MFLVNNAHSDANKVAIFSGEIGVDVAGTDLNVCSWCDCVIIVKLYGKGF